jgi:acetylornithine deacetylase
VDRVIGLLDAMPYLRAYSGQTFVVKVGGELLKNNRWRDGIATELAVLHRLGIKVVLVHGGGPQLDDAARAAGVESQSVGGRRITTPALLDLAIAEWRGRLSTAFVTALHLAGERAIGLSGLDGGLLRAVRRPPRITTDDAGERRTVDYGLVGDLREVRADVLHALLPFRSFRSSPRSRSVSRRDAQRERRTPSPAEIRVALKAAKLVLLTRAPGILQNPGRSASVLHWTDLHELQQLLEQGRLTGGCVRSWTEFDARSRGACLACTSVDGQEPQGAPRRGSHHGGQRDSGGAGSRRHARRAAPMSAVTGAPPGARLDPVVTGDEQAICAFLATRLRERGLDVEVSDRNLACRVRGKAPGPVLLLSSHTDVVPPGEGWSRAPFEPHRDGFRLVGRGANDAKASVASMAVAMEALFENPPEHGEVVFAATCEEERGRKGLEAFLPSLGKIDAALVGEPTSLEPAIAQNGLLILELTARGKAGHAARPESAINAISIAGRRRRATARAAVGAENAWVGPMTLQVTQIAAGHAHNLIPGECTMVVDVRTIRRSRRATSSRRVRATVQSEVRVRSSVSRRCTRRTGAAILDAILAVRPDARPHGSPTVSDWAHLRGIPAVKIGPGRAR